MNAEQLSRVRNDLETVKAAMGGLPYGPADVGFYVAGAIFAGIFAVSHAFGAQEGWPLAAALLPVSLVALAYAGHMALISGGRAQASGDRRQEYRRTLVLVPVTLIVAVAFRKWAEMAGMNHLQFGGALALVAGLGLLAASFFNPAPRRYPRSTMWAVGVPLVAGGLVFPFCTDTQAITAVGAMGAAICALFAAALAFELRRQEEPDARD
jgi:hypothetical protein